MMLSPPMLPPLEDAAAMLSDAADAVISLFIFAAAMPRAC